MGEKRMNQKQLDYIDKIEDVTAKLTCSPCVDVDTRNEGMCSGCRTFLQFRDSLIDKEILEELGDERNR